MLARAFITMRSVRVNTVAGTPVMFHASLADCAEILSAQRFMAKMVVTHGATSQEAIAAAKVIATQAVLRDRLVAEIHAGSRIYSEIVSAVPSATLAADCRRIIPPPEPEYPLAGRIAVYIVGSIIWVGFALHFV